MSEARHPHPDAPHLIARFARWLLTVFFREIEVVGAEQVPRSGPVVFVANHTNGLVDPALLLGFLARRPYFLGKSTLWDMAILRPFLWLAAAIPVYRRQDSVDVSKNVDVFARCHEVLHVGGAIAIFPEGTSHNQPELVELKTGVSRIVLEAEAKYGGLGTRLVPVGLVFEAKSRFRSRALVLVGRPIDPVAEVERYRQDPRQGVRELTERVRVALEEVTLNFPSWQEARLIERAAEIFERPESELPAERPLSERFALRKDFIAAYRFLKEAHPAKVARVAEAVRAYDRLLATWRLSDPQVASKYPPASVARFAVRSLGLLGVRMPLAILGTLINLLPCLAVSRVVRWRVETPDVLATYKVIASLVFFPVNWLALTLAAGLAWGWIAAAGVALAGPLTGWVALRFHERREHFLRQARAFLVLRGAAERAGELRARRRQISAQVAELAEIYQRQAEKAAIPAGAA